MKGEGRTGTFDIFLSLLIVQLFSDIGCNGSRWRRVTVCAIQSLKCHCLRSSGLCLLLLRIVHGWGNCHVCTIMLVLFAASPGCSSSWIDEQIEPGDLMLQRLNSR